MAKYKKVPKEVDAVQWLGGSISSVPMWVSEALYKSPGKEGAIFRMGDVVHVFTANDKQIAKDGDYIVKEQDGRLWVCTKDIFEETYQKA